MYVEYKPLITLSYCHSVSAGTLGSAYKMREE